MAPRNFLSLRLQGSAGSAETDNCAGRLESAEKLSTSPHVRPQRRRGRSYNLTRIPKLLMLGYASEESQRRYEKQRNWKRLYSVLMFKIENITIVSGLLLASSCSLLVAGELRRMTHAAVAASIFGSILSVVFGLLCRINITPGRLEFLVTRTQLFYYLYSTPSLFGGAAALTFFVAVCAFAWLEESTQQYGWEAKVATVLMSGLLIANALACFALGAGVADMRAQPGEREDAAIQDARGKEQEETGAAEIERTTGGGGDIDDLESRNQRLRMHSSFSGSGDSAAGALGASSFGILAWGADRQWSMASDRESIPSNVLTRSTTFDTVTEGLRRPRRVQVRRPSQW